MVKSNLVLFCLPVWLDLNKPLENVSLVVRFDLEKCFLALSYFKDPIFFI